MPWGGRPFRAAGTAQADPSVPRQYRHCRWLPPSGQTGRREASADLYDDLITMLYPPIAARGALPAAAPPVLLLMPQRLSDRLAVLLGDQIHSGSLRPGD